MRIDYHVRNGVDDIDYISYINNWHQKEYGKEPEYSFYRTDGEWFSCSLQLKGYGELISGHGFSKKNAIRLAAKRAYEFVKENEDSWSTIRKALGDNYLNFDKCYSIVNQDIYKIKL